MDKRMLWNAITAMSNGLQRKQPVKRKHERPKEVSEKLKSKAQQKRERRAERNRLNQSETKLNQYDTHPDKKVCS